MPTYVYRQYQQFSCGPASLMCAAAELELGNLESLGNQQADEALRTRFSTPINLSEIFRRLPPLQAPIRQTSHPELAAHVASPSSPVTAGAAAGSILIGNEDAASLLVACVCASRLYTRRSLAPCCIFISDEYTHSPHRALTARAMGFDVEWIYLTPIITSFSTYLPDFSEEKKILTGNFKISNIPAIQDFPAMGEDSRRLMLMAFDNPPTLYHWIMQRADNSFMNPGNPTSGEPLQLRRGQLISENPLLTEFSVIHRILLGIQVKKRI